MKKYWNKCWCALYKNWNLGSFTVITESEESNIRGEWDHYLRNKGFRKRNSCGRKLSSLLTIWWSAFPAFSWWWGDVTGQKCWPIFSSAYGGLDWMKINILHNRPAVHFIFFFFFPKEIFPVWILHVQLTLAKFQLKKSVRFISRLTNTVHVCCFLPPHPPYLLHTHTYTHPISTSAITSTTTPPVIKTALYWKRRGNRPVLK